MQSSAIIILFLTVSFNIVLSCPPCLAYGNQYSCGAQVMFSGPQMMECCNGRWEQCIWWNDDHWICNACSSPPNKTAINFNKIKMINLNQVKTFNHCSYTECGSRNETICCPDTHKAICECSQPNNSVCSCIYSNFLNTEACASILCDNGFSRICCPEGHSATCLCIGRNPDCHCS